MQQFSHRTVLSVVGIRVQDVLPFPTMCGKCRGGMTVYDAPEGGTWVHCPDCGFAGSSVAYAAHMRDAPRGEWRAVLSSLGVTSENLGALAAYTVDDRFEILMELWARARARMLPGREGATGLYLLQAHALYTGIRGVQPWVGLLFGSDIRALHAGHPRVFALHGAGGNQSFLAVPRYDLPGRICGFSLLHSKGEAMLLPRVAPGAYDPGEGLACMETAWGTAGNVLAVDDLRAALMLHAQHHLIHGQYPAVVSFSELGPRASTWQALGTRRVTVLGMHGIAPAIHAAQQTVGGLVTSVPHLQPYSAPQQLAAQLAPYSSGTALPLAERNAHAWPDAARVYLLSDPAQLASRLRTLNLSAANLARVLGTCSDAERRVLSGLGSGAREAQVSGEVIRARDTGYWLVTRVGERELSDVVLNVTRMLTLRASRASWVAGEFVRGADRVAFCAPLQLFRETRKLSAWLSARFSAAGLRVPNINRAWLPRLLDIALQFSVPPTHEVPDTLGWDADTASVVLPALRIAAAGVERVPAPVLLPPTHVGVVPGTEWGATGVSCDQMAAFLTAEHPAAVAHAAYAVFTVLNMAASVAGRGAYGMALGVGDDYHGTLAAVGLGFGWDTVRDGQVAAALLSGQRGWTPVIRGFPVVVLPRVNKLAAYMARGAPPLPCVVGCTPFLAECASLYSGWLRLQLPVSVPAGAGAVHAAWPAAAAELAANALCLYLGAPANDDLYTTVVDCVLRASDAYGSRAAVYAALGRLRVADVPPVTWMARYAAILTGGVASGRIPQGAFQVTATGVRVYPAALCAAFTALGAVHPELDTVCGMAAAAGLSPRATGAYIEMDAAQWRAIAGASTPRLEP